MSVENFGGNGLVDQPSIIYAFEADDTGEIQIRELSLSGFGEPGPSPGEVLERETKKSPPTDSPPELDIPGQDGLATDGCGEDIPVFACTSECGKPVYVGRTCSSLTCERDWATAVKRKVVRTAGKLEELRRALYARYDGQKDIDFNHVVASVPSLLVDFSHASVRPVADRDELMSRMKGNLHNCNTPGGVGAARDLWRGSADTTRHSVISE